MGHVALFARKISLSAVLPVGKIFLNAFLLFEE
jgi:hypothetical protein